ncbi:MAG TPA: DUF362 domain-containing protein [Candidatus Acidoferrales bacterium]|nr:DUF362 domain-containing protein [Candidatus Acidoferrales bacterium]
MPALNRRQFLLGSVAASAALIQGCRQEAPRWEKEAYRKPRRSQVAVLAAKSYDMPLREELIRGIKLFGLDITNKRVVLKPNLVEYDPQGVINTHPSLIYAAIEAFKSLGAREVVVAEGPGHRRDNEYLVTASGFYSILRDTKTSYVDLNNDDVRKVKLKSHFTELGSLYLPETVLGADLLVSMPKLKTHHWAGVTLSMKNMFGIVPGAIYGWPKNVLHWAGLQESILDINSSLAVPQFAIVDGIVGMEGNGPIQGRAKHVGVLILGNDWVAVDATAARLMNVDPKKIPYLQSAGDFLGNIEPQSIEQIGDRLDRFQQDFQLVPIFQPLKSVAG